MALNVISICFSGMDGSGKSTQCRRLVKFFQEMDIDAKLIHILSPGKTVGSRSQSMPSIKGIHRRLRDLPGEGLSRGIKLCAGLTYYLVDSWLSHIVHRRKYGDKVVIYDRYFFDPLVIFAAHFKRIPRWVIRFSKVLPRSGVTIIMEAPPEVSKQRKPEHSVEILEAYFELYRQLASVLKVKMIDGTTEMTVIQENVIKQCQPIFDEYSLNHVQ